MNSSRKLKWIKSLSREKKTLLNNQVFRTHTHKKDLTIGIIHCIPYTFYWYR